MIVNAKFASLCLTLLQLSQPAHEFVTQTFMVEIQPNRLPERLFHLGRNTKSIYDGIAVRDFFQLGVSLNAHEQSSKLAELRARTDRELVSIIDNALEFGLRLVAHEPNVEAAAMMRRNAADIYTDSLMLVQKVEVLRERQRLEETLRKLRSALDRQARTQTAST